MNNARRRRRPELLLELPALGTVNPFGLCLGEQPPGSGEFFVCQPGKPEPRARVERAGVGLVGAGRALFGLSMRWMDESGAGPAKGEEYELLEGEMHLVVRRREAQLLAALLRRHRRRLPQAPPWMGKLQRSLEQLDEYLRWEDP